MNKNKFLKQKKVSDYMGIYLYYGCVLDAEIGNPLLSFENVLIIGTAQNIPLNVHVNTLFMGSVLGLDYEMVMRKWKIV